ncbi:MAG: hypothetical protein ACYC9Z_07850 [Casimicrobiaceae bacterium]
MIAITNTEFESRFTDDLVRMWRESFEHGVGLIAADRVSINLLFVRVTVGRRWRRVSVMAPWHRTNRRCLP